MVDEIKDRVVDEVADLTLEERADAWVKWVKGEVNSALDIYLDMAISSNINVRYYPHVIETQESGPVTDTTKADGVLLSIELEFEKPIDLRKPRVEDEIEE